MKRVFAIGVTLTLTLAGCRAAAPLPMMVEPDLQVGSMAQRTDFELGITDDSRRVSGDARAEGPPPPPEEPTQSQAASDSPDENAPAESSPERRSQLRAYSVDDLDNGGADELDSDKAQKRRTALFWSGVVITAVGAAATIGLMAAGQTMENRLDDGYAGEMSRDRERRLRDGGKLTNPLAITGGGVTLLGLALLLAGYGLDYSACGKLAKRRKKCRNR